MHILSKDKRNNPFNSSLLNTMRNFSINPGIKNNLNLNPELSSVLHVYIAKSLTCKLHLIW